MNLKAKSSAKTLELQPWLSLLIVLALLLAVSFGAFKAIEQAPKRPIAIEQSNLSTVQAKSLQDVISPLGDVRFFDADLAGIHKKVVALSWVESADVRRDWQKGVMVSVVPRRAVANFGSQHLLDANGLVFVPADEHELMDQTLVQLYSSQPTDAPRMMKQMQFINDWYAPLGMIAKDVTLTSRQTWLVRFNNGVRVVVDHENAEQKLYRLSLLLGGSLAKELPNIQSVDLRYKNGFAVAWKNRSDESKNNGVEPLKSTL